ncbi:MAG: hypothetical protein QGH60_21550 [Phycisphaerae bacterium]|jgi:hypothetical protein|nr:hypothetical protein [Phycisphaerae bacterium]
MMNNGHRNRLLWIFAVVLTAGPLSAAEPTTKPAPGRIRLTVSRKTTHILGPVNKDGTVNYAAYLNAKRSKGVTKANNAAIPLIEILGPNFLPKGVRGKMCKMLQIKLPAKGIYTSVSAYAEQTSNGQDVGDWVEYEDLDKAISTPWKPKRYPVMAKWLEVNDAALNATLVAVRRARYHVPIFMSSPDADVLTLAIPNVQPFLGLANALGARAMLKFDSGDMRGAWADLMAMKRLARRVGSGYTLIENTIGMALERTACSTCNAMAGSEKLTGAQALAFLVDMQRIGPTPDPMNVFTEGERLFSLDFMMLLARASNRKGLTGFKAALKSAYVTDRVLALIPPAMPHMRSLDWDVILTTENRSHDDFLKAAGPKTFKARKEALTVFYRNANASNLQINKSLEFWSAKLKRPSDASARDRKQLTARAVSQMIGNLLTVGLEHGLKEIGLVMPKDYGRRVLTTRDRTRTQSDLSVVAMALAAYRAEKKAYPDKLSQLAPGYLKKVPDDLFIDKPFGYKQTEKGYLLYSVGENMKYDGEKKKEDDEDEIRDDIVVRVE